MGKATGFMDYDRRDAECESPKERIKHFREFHTPLSKESRKYRAPDVWHAASRSARRDR